MAPTFGGSSPVDERLGAGGEGQERGEKSGEEQDGAAREISTARRRFVCSFPCTWSRHKALGGTQQLRLLALELLVREHVLLM